MMRPFYYYRNIPTPLIFHPYLYYPHYPLYTRELPEVNPNQFIKSAKNSLTLLSDVEICINKLANSYPLTKDIMHAAQLSKTETVKELIKSTGVKITPDISYNPDGITLTFDQKNNPPHCCSLSIQLRWR